MNNQRTTSEQPVNTPKALRSIKNTLKRSIWTPPKLEEVQAYCLERNNSIDAHKFISHYETTGWIRGKTPIKDWKACVRTWENGKTKAPNWSHPEGKL